MEAAEAIGSAGRCSDLLQSFLDGTERDEIRRRRLYGRLPTDPRCTLCYAPFQGAGARFMRLLGRRQFGKNPRVCEVCFRAMEVGGCEVDITCLFIDMRGSTTLADTLGPARFADLLDRYYRVATTEMVAHQAFIEITGDEVYAFYVPGLTGSNAVRIAIDTADRVMRKLRQLDLGAAVHAGPAWVGVVGDAQRIKDFRSVGDTVNVGARLVASAGPGECLISEAAITRTSLEAESLESRLLTLKGKPHPVAVRVRTMASREEPDGVPPGN